MRSRLVASFALAASFAVPQMAGAKSAASLQPLGSWQVDSTSERCRLSRQFGDAERPLHLLIDSYGSRSGFRVEVSGKSAPRPSGVSGTLTYRLSGKEDFGEGTKFLRGTSANGKALWFSMWFLPPEMDFPELTQLTKKEYWASQAQPETIVPDYERTTDEFTLRLAPGKTVSLNLGEMSQPLNDLRLCVDGLIKSWGRDPSVQRELTRRPIPDPSSVDKLQKSYPPEMLKQLRNAFVPVRIMVDADGTATDCVIQRYTVDESFKGAICDNLVSQFQPALDADGKPVPSVFLTSVIFSINR
ncbi:hypothetical protein [Erythrobacter sp. SG61-1L]|uniref:hypothetical protein n=1 Tax=Erythrobacter sp. SG61-1L TaxID=1603897 RepID=UPI000AA04035|nr:hypothetical protein [Erythrobacter sp. SG61-1L]